MRMIERICDLIDSDEAILGTMLSIALFIGIIIGVSIRWVVVGG